MKLQSTWNFSKYFGVGQSFSVRYSKESKLYLSDFFRDKKSSHRNPLVGTSASELYFHLRDAGLALAESFIFRQVKAGAFFDYSYTGGIEYATGGFARLNISLVGLADFIVEAGGGYNFATGKPFGYFKMNNKM